MHLQAIPIHRPQQSASCVYRLEGVDYTYPNGSRALRGINLCIHEGDRIALLGHNGSGKTTLARVLSGLARPTRGRVLFEEVPLEPHRLGHLRKKVGFLFQDPDDQLFCTSVLDDVLFGLINFQTPPEGAAQRALGALARLGLEDTAHKPPHHLSYGQRKRAALAAVLALDPSVLILDEPTANLDPASEDLLAQVLKGYAGTLICISHDLLFLYGLCTRAVVLQDGCLHHDTSFEALISHRPSLQEHGLDFTFRFRCCDSPGRHVGVGRRPVRSTANAPSSSLPPARSAHACGASAGEARSDACQRPEQPPILELHQYTYRYKDGAVALRDVSLQVRRGERVALVGPNGAGKSTLAACLAGIRSGCGRYRFDGKNVDNRRRRELWRHVGLLFQDSADQTVCSRCYDEVAFGLRNLGWPESKVHQKVRAMLRWAGLGDLEDRVPQHLSGGERKRLALASVLAMEPDVLILDEPTAGLDPQAEENLLKLLDEVEATILLISHDICFVSMLTDRTILLHRGKIVRDVPTWRFLKDENLHSLYGLDFTYYNRCCREIQHLQESAAETADGKGAPFSGR